MVMSGSARVFCLVPMTISCVLSGLTLSVLAENQASRLVSECSMREMICCSVLLWPEVMS